MTIKEYAESKAVSTGAIYKAVSRSGHSMKDLTDRKGQITGKGLSILREIYPDDQEPDQEPLSDSLKDQQPEDSVLEDLRERLREAERAREKAEESLRIEKEQRSLFEKLYNETKDELRDQRISAEKEREQYRILIRAEQGLRMKAERNLFQRVKVFFLGEKNQPVDSVDTHGEVK